MILKCWHSVLGSSPTRSGEDLDGIALDEGLVLVGVAISWENRDAYYIALTQQEDLQGGNCLCLSESDS